MAQTAVDDLLAGHLLMETVMLTSRLIQLTITGALFLSVHPVVGKSGFTSGLYQITSGSFSECCGIAGDFRYSLPKESQRFVRLAVDPQGHFATMTFLGNDQQTVFSAVACPSGDPIPFRFNYGFVFSNHLEFRVDPGPPPNCEYWSYTVTNSTGGLRIDGMVGLVGQLCADAPDRFSHSNV
jgi:hypothetical protein